MLRIFPDGRPCALTLLAGNPLDFTDLCEKAQSRFAFPGWEQGNAIYNRAVGSMLIENIGTTAEIQFERPVS